MRAERTQRLRWLVFCFVAAAFYGDLYEYDSIGPVADLLQRQRHFTDTQVGLLNAIYSLPNILLILVGGVLVDRFGAARITLATSAICLAGAALTALSPGYVGMAAGRLLFGIGAETLAISVLATIARYFVHHNLPLAMALHCRRAPGFILRRYVAAMDGAELCRWLAAATVDRHVHLRRLTAGRVRLLVDRSSTTAPTQAIHGAPRGSSSYYGGRGDRRCQNHHFGSRQSARRFELDVVRPAERAPGRRR